MKTDGLSITCMLQRCAHCFADNVGVTCLDASRVLHSKATRGLSTLSGGTPPKHSPSCRARKIRRSRGGTFVPVARLVRTTTMRTPVRLPGQAQPNHPWGGAPTERAFGAAVGACLAVCADTLRCAWW